MTWTTSNEHKTRAGRPKWILIDANGQPFRTVGKHKARPEGVVWTCNSERRAENKIDELEGRKPRWTSILKGL